MHVGACGENWLQSDALGCTWMQLDAGSSWLVMVPMIMLIVTIRITITIIMIITVTTIVAIFT